MAYFPENPSIFTGEADVVISETSSSFIRPEIAAHADPFIATATIGYKEGTRDQAHEGWRTVTTETEKSEPGTLAYYIFKDIANATNAGTFEIYTDETYFRDVHAKSKVVAENRAKYGNEIRTSFKFVLLKLVAGWLRRDEAESTG
jgi:quinol monooxygenase YgiN